MLMLNFYHFHLFVLYFHSKKGFNVQSFGTGANVKLPGSAPDKPNVYEFNKTTYDEMYKELKQKDKDLYPLTKCSHSLSRERWSSPFMIPTTDSGLWVLFC